MLMKWLLEVLKSSLLAGLLIILPAWLAVLLLMQLLVKLAVLVKPLAATLPSGINHPLIIASLAFMLLCISVGLLFRTAIGQQIGRNLGENVFSRLPGYQSLRNIARQFSDMDTRDGFKPALIQVEDGCLAPAFLIDIHANGYSTVFMPSVPTPLAGSIFIMPSGRVLPINVSVTTMMKCISKWGAGSGDLMAALTANPKVP